MDEDLIYIAAEALNQAESFFEDLIVSQLVQKFPKSYVTRMFIAAFTKFCSCRSLKILVGMATGCRLDR